MSKGYTVEVYKDGFVSNKTSVAKLAVEWLL
jgi:hypothetical protein